MKLSICQVYVKAGVSFPFSHVMQRWVGGELSVLVTPSEKFVRKYGEYSSLVIFMSAERGTRKNRVVGPGVNRKTRDVEYTVFLPFDVVTRAPNGCRSALEFLMDGIESVLRKAAIEVAAISSQRDRIIEKVCQDPAMLSAPWLRE